MMRQLAASVVLHLLLSKVTIVMMRHKYEVRSSGTKFMAQMGLLKGCLGRHKGCISYRVVWENPPRVAFAWRLAFAGWGLQS
jgi:hypothetical protein